MFAVSRGFLDRIVGHHLALTIGRGEVPPAGLLQVAETIGGADWQPAMVDLHAALGELIAHLPEELLDSKGVASALKNSDIVELDGIEDSWFEDSAELAEQVMSAGPRAREKLPAKLLRDNGAIGAQRARWAELFVFTALWMRENPAEYPAWADLAVVARAVLGGHDLNELGLMHAIAARTVEYLSEEDDDLDDMF